MANGLQCYFLQDPKCSIVKLNLSHNDFMESGVDVLANALQVIISLTIGAVFMTLSVQFNSSVTTLILNGCKIGAKGGIHVASMLQVTLCLHIRGWWYILLLMYWHQ